MSRKYQIHYSVYVEANPSAVEHKHYEFESDSEILGALDEGMVQISVQEIEANTRKILYRKIELLNPKEVYKHIIQQARSKNAK